MKIASWNVNSLRVRLAQVQDWLQVQKPDVLALQEIKMPDEQFPYAAFTELGFHAIAHGQPTYNGVAFLVKDSFEDVSRDIPFLSDDPLQRRALALTYQGIRIINLYVPNGESLLSPKFTYKLNWLCALKDYLATEQQRYAQLVVLGDFNIAPADRDVHDPQAWAGHVLVSAEERLAFEEIQALGLIDAYRHLNATGTDYSWWDYRQFAFKRNMGLRIDHMLVSQSLLSFCKICHIDKAPRALERPSDHAPIVLTLSLA